MDKEKYILVVDDEEMNRFIIEDLIEDEFELGFAENGQECLDLVAQRAPDLILMDVNMPVMNGLDACQKIKEDPQTQMIPVIFVSSLASNAEIMSGYEVGGDDYVTKPFDQKQLRAKINVLIKINEQIAKEVEGKSAATDMAMSVMTGAAENGLVVQFMREVISLETLEDVETQLKETLSSLELSACAIVEFNGQQHFLELGRTIKPIEKDVLIELAKNQPEKIKSFSNKCSLKNPLCLLLIRAMPDDIEKTGRYKDHLAVLIDSLQSKLVQFDETHKKMRHYAELATVTEQSYQQLTSVRRKYQQQRLENITLLTDLENELEKLYLNLGLTEEQERMITSLVSNAESESNVIYDKGEESMQVFDTIIEDLRKLHDL